MIKAFIGVFLYSENKQLLRLIYSEVFFSINGNEVVDNDILQENNIHE